MANTNLVRAWKDEEYRLSLCEADRACLLESPAGALELSDVELEGVNGGWSCGFTIAIGDVHCKKYSVQIFSFNIFSECK